MQAQIVSPSLFFSAPLSRRRAAKVLHCSFPGTCLILSRSLCRIQQLCHHAGCSAACVLAAARLAHCWHAVLTGAEHIRCYKPTILQASLQAHTWTEMDGSKAWILISFPPVMQMLCCAGVSLYLSVCLLQSSDNNSNADLQKISASHSDSQTLQGNHLPFRQQNVMFIRRKKGLAHWILSVLHNLGSRHCCESCWELWKTRSLFKNLNENPAFLKIWLRFRCWALKNLSLSSLENLASSEGVLWG